MIIAFQFDNNNPGLWRMGSTEDPMYLATTDFPYPQRFDINTFETLELLRPTSGFGTSGCTHWQREPGTDNSINFAVKVRFKSHTVVPNPNPNPNPTLT